MQFDLKRPCANCPFRTDITFHLRPERVREILRAITYEQRTFTCHKTTIEVECEDGFSELVDGPDSQHCAGAMILLEKIGRPNQMMRWMERIGRYDRTKLDMSSPVFSSVEAMVAHFDGLNRNDRKKP